MGKKKQQGNGSGTVYARKNKDGKITRYLGAYHTPDGKRRTVSAKTKTECREKLRQAMSDADKGIVFDTKGQTIGAFLERWLEDVVRPNKAHRTYSTHKQQVRSHIVPAIGRAKLEVCQEETEPLDAGQARSLLDAARGDRFEALYVLCLMAGLRQGEALGLKWSAVDLDAGTLQVQRQLQRVRRDGEKPGTLEFSEPKNASRRTVGLPQRAITALSAHRKRQLEELAQGGLRVAGDRPHLHHDEGYTPGRAEHRQSLLQTPPEEGRATERPVPRS